MFLLTKNKLIHVVINKKKTYFAVEFAEIDRFFSYTSSYECARSGTKNPDPDQQH